MGLQGKVKNKRSLGQNFFVNRNLAEQISDIVTQEEPDLIVEIGPGTGSFTQFLAQQDTDLILVEKDNALSKALCDQYPNANVKNYDFLQWDFTELEEHAGKRILFFGSLPYNVSKRIIKKIIRSKYFVMNCYFIIQKEVALKYTSQLPNNNLLSLTTSLFADVQRVFDISRDSFKPKPNVTSSFIKFSPKDIPGEINIADFEKFLKISFMQPRKTLRNNTKGSYLFAEEETEVLLSKRPQHLSLDDFLFLFSNIR